MVDPEGYEEDTSRSIFAAFWFRALLVVIVLGVVAVLAVPYVLDMVSSKEKAAMAPAPTVTPGPAPSPTPAPTSPASPPAITEPAKPEEPAAPTAKSPEPTPPAPARPDPTPRAQPSKPSPAAPRARATGAAGPYWVQVGAFREAAVAKRVADRLRAANYNVDESVKPGGASVPAAPPASAPSAGADRYNVFVSGATPAEVNAKVSTKGFSADAVAGGVAVKPSLSLKEAVDLSRELAGEGMKVQVRRASSASPTAPAPAPSPGGETWYRVRVGSFADRSEAVAVLKELEAKGYKPFLARGAQ